MMDTFGKDTDVADSSLNSIEIVNKFLREAPDPTTDILVNVNGIHDTLTEVVGASGMRITIDINNISDYKKLYNCLTGDITQSSETLSKEYGQGQFTSRVMTNDEILDPENDNITGILPTQGGNPEEATVGLLILKKNLQTHANEQIYYVPNPNELMITLGGD